MRTADANEEQLATETQPRRPRWRRVVIIVLLGIVGLSALAFADPGERGRLPDLSGVPSSTHIDAELSVVVQVLAGHDAIVQCHSHADWRRQTAMLERRWPQLPRLGPWSGYTWTGPFARVDLSAPLCLELTRLRRLTMPVWDDAEADALAWSVGALAHEAVHASGNRNEVEATCFGMQRIPAAAVALGRTAAEGHHLAELYWRLWYERVEPSYLSGECRDGGRLDIRPSSDVWP